MADSDEDIGVEGTAGGRAEDNVSETDDIQEEGHPVPNAAEAALQVDTDTPMEMKPLVIPPKPSTFEEEKQYIK